MAGIKEFASIVTMLTVCCATGQNIAATVPATNATIPAKYIKLLTLCENLPYADPFYPNVLGHQSFKDAFRNFESFESILWSKCSQNLAQYMCLLHFPTNDESTNKAVPPCWEFCLKVRTECLLMLPVPWPKSFSCESLPSKITPGSKCYGEDFSLHSTPPVNVREVFEVARGIFSFIRDAATTFLMN